MGKSVSLPQASAVDAALALVCATPTAGRHERRVSVQAVVDRAVGCREIASGVSLVFDASGETARMVTELALAERECCAHFAYTIAFAPHGEQIELRVEATGALVRPLKDLYLGLTMESRNA